MSNIVLKEFDPEVIEKRRKTGNSPNILIIGKKHTGKTVLLEDLVYHQRDIPIYTVMSETEEANHIYRHHHHELMIHSKFNGEIIDKLIQKQRQKIIECDRRGIDPASRPEMGMGLILDDCGYDKKIFKKENMRQIFMNGRHWKITCLITLQYMMDIPPELRANADYVFVLRNSIRKEQYKLWEHFFGIFPHFKEFQQVLEKMTNDYGCLVLDQTSKSTNITDQVFYYKATPGRQYKIGSINLWKELDLRFNREYALSSLKSDTSSGIKRKDLIEIRKGPKMKLKENETIEKTYDDVYPGNRKSFQYENKNIDHRENYILKKM